MTSVLSDFTNRSPAQQFVDLMRQSIHDSASHSCKVHLPYPLDLPIPESKKTIIPKTFRIDVNYKKKLKECQCNAIYQQYSAQQLKQLYDNGRLGNLAPRFAIAPVNADISFMNKVKTYAIEKKELEHKLEKAKSLPTYFNWHDVSQDLTKVVSQGMCGQCWAVSTATCLSDLFTIQKKIENPKLSPTFLLSCYPQNQCDGGDPFKAVSDIQKNGILSADCINDNWCAVFTGCGGNTTIPFDPKTVNKLIPQCNGCMDKGIYHKKYYIEDATAICVPPDLTEFPEEDRKEIQSYLENMYGNLGPTYADLSGLSYKDIQNLIKEHIHTKGPVLGGMHIFNNFFRDDFAETNQIYIETQTYKGVPGIDYSNIQDNWAGSHAVVLVGWGREKIKDEDVDYWIVRNSWGVSWGTDGYCKIAMYGNDPSRQYQNRICQFEYPSILYTDEGIVITGGVILITPGKIEEHNPTILQRGKFLFNKNQTLITWLLVALFIIFLIYKSVGTPLMIPLLLVSLYVLWFTKK